MGKGGKSSTYIFEPSVVGKLDALYRFTTVRNMLYQVAADAVPQMIS
jgi:hypothetical protein